MALILEIMAWPWQAYVMIGAGTLLVPLFFRQAKDPDAFGARASIILVVLLATLIATCRATLQAMDAHPGIFLVLYPLGIALVIAYVTGFIVRATKEFVKKDDR